MYAFIENKIVWISTLIGVLVAVVFFILNPSHAEVRVEYSYLKDDMQGLPELLERDTLFAYGEKLVIQNYTTSIADSVKTDEINFGEMRFVMQQTLSNKEVLSITKNIIHDAKVETGRLKGSKKVVHYRTLFIGTCVGLLLGLSLHFILSLSTSKPKNPAINPPV